MGWFGLYSRCRQEPGACDPNQLLGLLAALSYTWGQTVQSVQENLFDEQCRWIFLNSTLS